MENYKMLNQYKKSISIYSLDLLKYIEEGFLTDSYMKKNVKID